MKKLSIITTTYKSEKYLETYFRNITKQVDFDNFEIILILNEPSIKEKEIFNYYKKLYLDNIKIIQVGLENISTSINRGFKLAESEFVTCIDVDDLRKTDSLIRQIKTLNSSLKDDYTYGDFIIVPKQGVFKGIYIKTPEFTKIEAIRSSVVGPNHFFRKKILNKCGYWDEQFKSGGDFDFQVRAALNVDFKKTPGDELLYYTRYKGSGSASSSILQQIERTVIELRYGIYDKINYKYLPKALEYDIYHVYYNGEKKHISELIPNYFEFIEEKYKKYFKKGIKKNLINPIIIEKFNLGLKYFFNNPVVFFKKIIKKI
jgi:glycosyltransferase involved in cell wall biosynthesis